MIPRYISVPDSEIVCAVFWTGVIETTPVDDPF